MQSSRERILVTSCKPSLGLCDLAVLPLVISLLGFPGVVLWVAFVISLDFALIEMGQSAIVHMAGCMF